MIGRQVNSDAQTRREKCVNIRRYRPSGAEVRGTWCTKNDGRTLSPVVAISVKMAVRKNRSSEKCIYFQTLLFVLSLKLLLERF